MMMRMSVIVLAVLGIGVDAYSGANLDHEPNPVIAHLLVPVS